MNIEWLKNKAKEKFYPITHAKAVLFGNSNKTLDEEISDINNSISSHTSNTSNPHSVTKAQVGLGSVENCGIASINEAKAGNVNNKYMTPQRVKEAVEGFGVISDGNTIIKVGGAQPSVQSGKTIIWIDTSS